VEERLFILATKQPGDALNAAVTVAFIRPDGFDLLNFPNFEMTIHARIFMNEFLQYLIELQSLEFGTAGDKKAEAAKAELRAKIPSQILGHYDRLVARGKKGIAVVRDQVCTSCHIRLPIGVIMTLMHGQDIQLCENCGRYLCLPLAVKTGVTEPTGSSKPKKKTRKPKKPLQVV
jgi:hypothetical protein